MIGYFTVGTDTPEAALKFYDTLFSNVREDRLWKYGEWRHEPDAFGIGRRITSKTIDFEIVEKRISYLTFLLPPSRRNLEVLERLGALAVGEIE